MLDVWSHPARPRRPPRTVPCLRWHTTRTGVLIMACERIGARTLTQPPNLRPYLHPLLHPPPLAPTHPQTISATCPRLHPPVQAMIRAVAMLRGSVFQHPRDRTFRKQAKVCHVPWCVHVYVRMRERACVRACARACGRAGARACVCVRVRVCMCMRLCLCMCLCLCLCLCLRVHACACD